MKDKTIKKALKILGKETMDNIEKENESGLKALIVRAEHAMKDVAFELESNPKYEELRENLKVLTQGKKDVFKRQKMIIEYALNILDGNDNDSNDAA